jgi:hypothetical protein
MSYGASITDAYRQAAIGQAAIDPAIALIKSRRLIAFLKAQDQPSYRLKPAYWKGAHVFERRGLQVSRLVTLKDSARVDPRLTVCIGESD